ncbi:ATP-binding protein [Streptomyces sp. NPDC057638]|uniref:ATP-binding protein n=1 Tax=Streptomyces sp. NPDC057638 TaxID=3346190 RepID=UPI0036A078D8
MDTEGTYDAHGTRFGEVPRPAGAPPQPSRPPMPQPPTASPASALPPRPAHAPLAGPSLGDWLRVRRPDTPPGVWRYGHVPRPAEEPDRVPGASLLSGAVISFLAMVLLWSLYINYYIPYWLDPLYWTSALVKLSDDAVIKGIIGRTIDFALIVGFVVFFARLGRWAEVIRRYVLAPFKRAANPREGRPLAPIEPGSPADPALWPELRALGHTALADRLADEVRSGRMNDVDYTRIRQEWGAVETDPSRLAGFTDSVLTDGAAAFAHPSGTRDLTARTARHDLLAHQVRIGTAADGSRNPYPRRTTGLALEPALLGTSLLAVGPSGCGKSVRLVRPVVESMCLLALAGRAAVVVVGGEGARLAPDDAFDLVLAVGRDEGHDLDLYGGSDDPDEAARILAEALVGDLAATLPGGDSRRAALALAQLIGPYRRVHGRFPAVPELRELLGGSPGALAALREELEAAGGPEAAGQLRELDARERQAARADDVGVLLSERISFLDRPAFARSFRTDGGGRAFSLRSIEHPVRVRVDLPERGHAEASRIVARLLLAQFAEAALGRADRSLFAALVLDDAAHTVTADSVRSLQRLRSANAGVVLALRTLEDVPEPLRGPLLGAVGCRMAFAGLGPWDGNHFAEAWGTEWVQTRDVTNRQIISDEPLTKAMHLMRRLATGKAVTSEAVTVREVERARWSASDLTHAVPPGHAVLSLTSVRGDHVPPLLVDLRT